MTDIFCQKTLFFSADNAISPSLLQEGKVGSGPPPTDFFRVVWCPFFQFKCPQNYITLYIYIYSFSPEKRNTEPPQLLSRPHWWRQWSITLVTMWIMTRLQSMKRANKDSIFCTVWIILMWRHVNKLICTQQLSLAAMYDNFIRSFTHCQKTLCFCLLGFFSSSQDLFLFLHIAYILKTRTTQTQNLRHFGKLIRN